MLLQSIIAIGLSFLIFLAVGSDSVIWFLDVFMVTIILIWGAYQTAEENGRDATLPIIATIAGGILLFVAYLMCANSLGPLGVVFIMVLVISSFVELAVGNGVMTGAYLLMALLGGIILIPIFAAWGPVAQSKATEVGMSAPDLSLRLSAVGQVFSSYLNNTMLVLTNPDAWYRQQFVTSGKREEGATSLGVEISKIEIIPSRPFASVITDSGEAEDQEARVLITITNKGEDKAQTGNNVTVIVGLDKYAIDKGARIRGDDGNPTTVAGKVYDKVYPETTIYTNFDILTPFCVGTFKLNTILEYQYNTSALFTIRFMDYYYFHELLKRKKVNRERKYSISSAGPFKITMQTELQPVLVKNGVSENFTLFVTIQNERSGNAFIDFLNVYVPEDVELIDCKWDGPKTSDIKGYKLYSIMEKIDGSESSKESIEAERCVLGQQLRTYYCKARFIGDVVDSEQRTFLVKFGYHYQYEKTASFSTTTVFPKLDPCTKITEKDIPESRKLEGWDKFFAEKCFYYKKNNLQYSCIVRDLDSAKSLFSELTKKCAEIGYSSGQNEEKVCVNFKLDVLNANCNESVKINGTAIKEGFESEGSTTEKEKSLITPIFVHVSVDNIPDKSKYVELSSAYIYNFKVTYARGLCGIGSKVTFTLLSKSKDNYECNLPDSYPCADNSQCASRNCNDAYKYLLARRSGSSDQISYESLMTSTNNFLMRFLTYHLLNIPSDAIRKLGYDKYSYYQFWSNPDVKDNMGNYILPQEIRDFIKKVKESYLNYVDLKHTLRKDESIWTFLPAQKVCQPAECTYNRDFGVSSPEVVAGCECQTPYVSTRYFYPGFNSYFKCVPLCDGNAFVDEKKCFCAPQSWYNSIDSGSTINFRILDDYATSKAKILEKTAISSCASEDDVGKTATICCIFHNDYYELDYPGKVTATCMNRTYTDEEGNKQWKLLWAVRYSDIGIHVYDELDASSSAQAICEHVAGKISEQMLESPEVRKSGHG